MLDVTFYGVRGSTPCSDDDSMRYGGNTSCVSLQADGDPIIFDLGTGLRYFGEAYARSSKNPFRGTALVTHLHWDHVQGLPFFTPLHVPGAHLDIIGVCERHDSIADAFAEFMTPPYFPIRVEELVGRVTFRDVGREEFMVGTARVMARRVPHVGATNGYRVEWGGATVAYISDHQEPLHDHYHVADDVLELADRVDLLIHDAQFTESEFRDRAHWGHCTIDYALEVARQAGARSLALFHHDPSHPDEFLDAVAASSHCRAAEMGMGSVIVAYEGLRLRLAGNCNAPAIDQRRSCLDPAHLRPGAAASYRR